MPRLRKCAWWRHLVVALGCLHLVGGPVAVLQVVAWAGMLARYTAEDGLVQGVTDTFSGERPCSLCLKVRDMEREAPDPAWPSDQGQRRLVEALGQSLRSTEFLSLPNPHRHLLVRSAGGWVEMDRPEDPAEGPETPPPRPVA